MRTVVELVGGGSVIKGAYPVFNALIFKNLKAGRLNLDYYFIVHLKSKANLKLYNSFSRYIDLKRG